MMQRYKFDPPADGTTPKAIGGSTYVSTRSGGVALDMLSPRGARITFDLSADIAREIASQLIMNADLIDSATTFDKNGI